MHEMETEKERNTSHPRKAEDPVTLDPGQTGLPLAWDYQA